MWPFVQPSWEHMAWSPQTLSVGLDRCQILQRGGNAVDAAVAATFAEGVVNPHMHTLGGEAPMLILMAATAARGAERQHGGAPGATIDWFREHGMSFIPGEGLLAAGVPAAATGCSPPWNISEPCHWLRCSPRLWTLGSAGFPMHPGLHGPSDYLPFSIWHAQEKFRERWPSSAQLYMPGADT